MLVVSAMGANAHSPFFYNRVNICYFALSPEDEARDAARHIRDQGKQAPLVLIPRSSLAVSYTHLI